MPLQLSSSTHPLNGASPLLLPLRSPLTCLLGLLACALPLHAQTTACLVANPSAAAQSSGPAATPLQWVRAASANQISIIDVDGNYPLRYLIRKKDSKSDTLRDVIESRDGSVARLVQRDGRALTPEEDAAERTRLNDLLDHPTDFFKHAHHDLSSRKLSEHLVAEMPAAMLFQFTAEQPQLSGRPPQAVIDFAPNPAYHPPTMKDEVLTGIAGRVWIDCTARRVTRIEVRVLHTTDLAYGMVARIYPGGTLEFEQTPVGADRWVYSKLRENLTVRAVLFKTIHDTTAVDAASFQLLPTPLTYQQAIHALLDTPLPK